MHIKPMDRAVRRGVCLAAVLALCAGCGDSNPTMNVVKGAVTLNGTALPGGELNFVSVKGSGQNTALIGPDGTYSVQFTKDALGDYKVAVKGPGRSSDPKEKRAAVPIPAKYSNPATSGITCTVKEGSQTFDIPLKK